MCRRQTGIGTSDVPSLTALLMTDPAIGRLCEKCDGKWWAYSLTLIYLVNADRVPFCNSSPVCDSYVRPETLVRICDECNFGTYGGRCIICGSPGLLLDFQMTR